MPESVAQRARRKLLRKQREAENAPPVIDPNDPFAAEIAAVPAPPKPVVETPIYDDHGNVVGTIVGSPFGPPRPAPRPEDDDVQRNAGAVAAAATLKGRR